MEQYTFPAWPDVAARLIAVAAGRDMADLVIRGGTWVNVHTRETLAGHDIAIAAITNDNEHGESQLPLLLDEVLTVVADSH